MVVDKFNVRSREGIYMIIVGKDIYDNNNWNRNCAGLGKMEGSGKTDKKYKNMKGDAGKNWNKLEIPYRHQVAKEQSHEKPSHH